MSKEQKAESSPRQDTRPEPGHYREWDHAEWEAHGLDKILDRHEPVYCNQYDDGDITAGEWFVTDDESQTIIYGSNNSDGWGPVYADVFGDYDSDRNYLSAKAEWEAQPEYLEQDEEWEDEPDEEPEEPEEGDYLTQDHQQFYQYGKLVVTVPEGEDWQEAVRLHMIASKYFTNVWFISDHGNAHLLEVC